MKQILTSLLVTYALTNGQNIPIFAPPPPPIDGVPVFAPPPPPVDAVPALISIATSAPQTTAAQTTAASAPVTTSSGTPIINAGLTAPGTTAPQVSLAPATSAGGASIITTARPQVLPIGTPPPLNLVALTSVPQVSQAPATTSGSSIIPPPGNPLATASGSSIIIPPAAPATTGSVNAVPATGTATGTGTAPAAPVTTGGTVNVAPGGIVNPPPVAITAATTTAPAPITPAPITPAPTMNQFCTPGLATMAQQQMVNNAGQGYSQCTSYTGPTSIARDMMGTLECVDGGCCMCSEITCGLSPGIPCTQASFGDFAAAGVQNIQVKGSMGFNMGGLGNWQQGTQISCDGQQSCRAARIVGELIGEMQCGGYYGCNDANIIINDPAPRFNLQCEGQGGCAGANIEINIRNCQSFAELGQLQFNGPMAATGASITVNNYCPTPVIIEHLDCQQQGSCQGTSFRFNGAVQIQHCEIFGAAQLPPQCMGFGGGFGGFPQFNPFPQPGFGFPQQPLPPQQFPQPLPAPPQQQPAPVQQPPANPVTPPAQQPPATPPQPVTPPQTPQTPPQQPAVPAPGQGQPQQPTPGQPQPQPGFGQPQPGFGMPMAFGAITAFGGQCEFAGQCRGLQTVNIQSNMFELGCAEMGSCSGLQLTLNIPPGGAIDFIEGFRFEAPFAAQGSTITINGGFLNGIEIGAITCEVMQSCAGVTIRAPGIDLANLRVECPEPGACTGGSINGISFDMLQGGNFQGGNFPAFGMGFPQQPQPGFGAPQQPQQAVPGVGGQAQQPQVPQYQYPPMGYPYYQI